jgi:hypothetical protein
LLKIAKVRRLYDIVNILTSLNLVQKVYTMNQKKQHAFKWIGEDLSKYCVAAPAVPVVNTTSTSNNSDNQLEEIVVVEESQEIPPVESIISPSKRIPLKKRKRTASVSTSESVPETSSQVNSLPGPDTSLSSSTTEDKENASRTGYVSPTERSGLHFQFHSPPPKRNRQTDKTEEKPIIQPLVFNTMLPEIPSTTKPISLAQPPLTNVTSRILNKSVTGTTTFGTPATAIVPDIVNKQKPSSTTVNQAPVSSAFTTILTGGPTKSTSPKITFKILDKSKCASPVLSPVPQIQHLTFSGTSTSLPSPTTAVNSTVFPSLLPPQQLTLPAFPSAASNKSQTSFQIGGNSNIQVKQVFQPVFVPIYVPINITTDMNQQHRQQQQATENKKQ